MKGTPMRQIPVWCACLAVVCAAGPARADVDPDRLAGLKARNIGPAGMSGRITSIDAVVSRPEIVYVGAATGGVWKSLNAGLTWSPVFDDQPVHAIGALAIFQKNPDVVWAGTGEGNTRNSASVGNGVYRSLDGGKTWQHLGLERTERIYRILLHPNDADTAYVCAPGPAWGESAERGVFRTADGGRSWKKVLYVDDKTGCGDLALDPVNPDKLFAAMWQFRRWPHFFKSGGPGSGLYLTRDGGASWRKLQEEDGLPKGELGRIGVAIAPSDPTVVYAIVEAEKSALVRSADGGKTWKAVNQKPNVAPRPFYFNDLRVDPAWPNRVYSVDFVIRVSDDGGKTFEVLPGAAWSQIHGDHHALWIHPLDPNRIYDSSDGGFHESRDRGKTFRFAGNLPLAQFYHVAVDDQRPYNVYGGLQDNGSWRGPSSVWQNGGIRNYQWLEVGGGDGFDVQPHPRDSQVGYSLWQGGNLMRYDLRTGEQRLIKPAEPAGVKLRFNWNAGLATDPFEPDTVYLGSQFLHVSRDRGESWTTISPDLTSNNPEWQKQETSGGLTPDVTAAENLTTIVAIAPSALEKGLIWVGSDDGRVHVTRDGGKSWTSVEKNLKGVPENTWVPHIEPSRFDAGTAFVVFDNHRRSDWTPYVFRTDDYGRTWKSLAAPDLRGYALKLAQDVVKKDLLFLGTEFGLYVSFDGGARWTHLKKTIPTASVMDMAIQPREHDLVIGTHGRAIWILDDIRPLRAMSESALAEPLKLYEIADAQQHWRRNEEGGFGFGASEFRGANREYGSILTYSLNLPGLPLHDEEQERARKETQRREQRAAAPPATGETENKDEKEPEPKVEIQVADASGRVVRTFKGPARLGVNRAVWDFSRDALKQLPQPEDAPPQQQETTGPELPPGAYTVTVKYESHSASQTVKVLPDPRSKNTAADWQKREDAILAGSAVWDRVADAVWRIRRTRDDVGVVQQKARQVAEAGGEKDKKKLDELPLVKAGDTLKQGLTKLEKRLWQAPETKGITADTDVLSQAARPLFYVQSSLDAPSPTHLELLRQAEARVDAFLAELDKFFEADLAAFRKQVEEAKLGLLQAAGDE